MENIAPDITRQRLLLEGFYTHLIGEDEVKSYLIELASHLNLRSYGTPIVHAPGGKGKEENEGYDAFLPLIDSGISLYVWTQSKFFALVLFSCKKFDAEAAVSFTNKYFGVSKLVSREF
jgi:S-adenosylmethionine decarboxylase